MLDIHTLSSMKTLTKMKSLSTGTHKRKEDLSYSKQPYYNLKTTNMLWFEEGVINSWKKEWYRDKRVRRQNRVPSGGLGTSIEN